MLEDMDVTTLDENGNDEYQRCFYKDATYDMYDKWVEDKQIYEYYVGGDRVSSTTYNDVIANSSLAIYNTTTYPIAEERIMDVDYKFFDKVRSNDVTFHKDDSVYFEHKHTIGKDSDGEVQYEYDVYYLNNHTKNCDYSVICQDFEKMRAVSHLR